MNTSQIYILIAIIGLLLIAMVFFFARKNKKKTKLTPLTVLAFAFIISGICFFEDRLITYSLIGIGIALAIIDAILKIKKRNKKKK